MDLPIEISVPFFWGSIFGMVMLLLMQLLWRFADPPRRRQKVYVIFDGAPTEPAPRFVEVENEWSEGVQVDWEPVDEGTPTDDTFWRLGPFELPEGE